MRKIIRNADLSMAMINADIKIAGWAIQTAESEKKNAKYIKSQAAYHLQQATEKLLKIQLYSSGKQLNHAQIYKHSITSLIQYAGSLAVPLIVPEYVAKNSNMITDWEAHGRYDLHIVVRISSLKKAYEEVSRWYEEMYKAGYR